MGLDSWFWIEGFDGSVTAPPITAFGLTIDVRMSSGTVSWDFGDGTVEAGDLGRAYPRGVDGSARAPARRHLHHHRHASTSSPEYRVDGGPWLTLPTSAVATTTHAVEERQAVVTQT